jgi:hypothetical protein
MPVAGNVTQKQAATAQSTGNQQISKFINFRKKKIKTPWIRDLLKKLIVSHLVKEISSFHPQLDGSLRCSQYLVPGPCSKPDKPNHILTRYFLKILHNPGQRTRYSDWLLAGRLRTRSSSPGRVKNVLFSMSSRPALGLTQPSIDWVQKALSWG